MSYEEKVIDGVTYCRKFANGLILSSTNAKRVEEVAKGYYVDHMERLYPAGTKYFWEHCTKEYQEAWRVIAQLSLEDEEEDVC